MLFYPTLKCIYLITIPTMLCCVTFMFLLFRLNNLMKLSQSVFWVDIHQPEKEGVERTFGWDELGKVPSVEAIVHLAGKAHDTKNMSEG